MQEYLDSIPIIGVFVVFAIASLVIYELGYRFGRWWQTRTPEEVEGPTGMIVGSLLALMAFMLAITMMFLEMMFLMMTMMMGSDYDHEGRL